MPRNIEDPTFNKHGDETHPAFGVAIVNNFSSGPPGATFFDSEIQHQHGITFSVYRASRQRRLNNDWIHSTRLPLVEIHMSQAQWGALVSSFGNGGGVPVTIRATESDYMVPGLPYAPRMATQVAETREAAKEGTRGISDAFDKLQTAEGAKAKREAMSHLKAMIDNLPSNLAFVEKQLAEHVETTVQKAKADIEAMMLRQAQQLGLDPAKVSSPLELTGTVDAGPEDAQIT